MTNSESESATEYLGTLSARMAALQRIITSNWLAATLGYILIFIITRNFQFGYPLVHIDEQFYLLVGERMLDGTLPYVDIWDRKPIGLFLLYAGFSAIPGDAVLAYQIAAMATTTATALVIATISREIAPAFAAWLAGMVYILFMAVFNSAMGQAPTYYNLLVASAGLGVINAVRRPDGAALIWQGTAIMALLGVAIQIKYSVVFEGMAFGLIMLWTGFKRQYSAKQIIFMAGLWVSVALLPTIAATLYYTSVGHYSAFIHANFISIFQRDNDSWSSPWRLFGKLLTLLPFWIAIFTSKLCRASEDKTSSQSHQIVTIWAGTAIFGFVVFGTWYEHYVAPLLVPLAILSAPVLAKEVGAERFAGFILLGFGALAGTVVPVYRQQQTGTVEQFSSMSSLIKQELNGRCLYVFEGDVAFYRTLDTCLPTTRLFPHHMAKFTEAKAIGVDPDAEMQRLLDSRPGVILTASANAKPNKPNPDTHRILSQRLEIAYEHYATARLGKSEYRLFRLRQALPDRRIIEPAAEASGIWQP